MKTKMMVLVSAVCLLANALFAQVTTPVTGGGGSSQNQGQQYYDAETLAQVAMNYVVDHYIVYFSATDNDTGNNLQMQMLLDGNLWVTNLTVNNTNIPLASPLGGIVIPTDGYRYAYLQVSAIDKFGQIAAQGSTNIGNLIQNQPINVTMVPQFPPVAIQLAEGLDPGSIIVKLTGTTGGYGYWYDPSTGLLTITLSEPSSTDIGYNITDGSGALLAHGKLPILQTTSGSSGPTSSVLSLHNAGGYISLPLGTDGYNYVNDQVFDCFVTRDNQPLKAKVIAVPDVANQSKLYISVNNWSGGNVEVRKWSQTGAMEVVPCTMSTDQNGNTTVITDQYMDKAIVTIIPTKDDGKTFMAWVGRSY